MAQREQSRLVEQSAVADEDDDLRQTRESQSSQSSAEADLSASSQPHHQCTPRCVSAALGTPTDDRIHRSESRQRTDVGEDRVSQ